MSPFNWTVFVSDEREHHYAHVNLVRDAPREFRPGGLRRAAGCRLGLAMAQWQTRSRYGEGELGRQAWDSPALGFLRWFAERPAYDGASEQPGCVWFLDLRFVNPGRDWVPFRFGACRDGPGAPWRAHERGESGFAVGSAVR